MPVDAPAAAPGGTAGVLDGIVARVGAQGAHEEIECPIAPKELPNGYRLRNYKVLSTLGAGGFGVTYLAAEDLLGRPVVIKENFPDILCHRESGSLNVRLNEESKRDMYDWALNNFLREVRLLATLDHPHIAKVYSYFEGHGTAYYVTEFVDGKSLADVSMMYAQRGLFIPQDALYALMVRVLDALDYLHRKNLLHRDIKPDNILVNKQGLPVLIDFGAAREEYGDGGATVVESLGFSPTEQSVPGGNMGPWTDLYALGATFYFMLTGECLPACQQRELYDTVDPLASRPELREHYHPRLLASIDRALAPEIERRFASVEQWMEELRASVGPLCPFI